jgi:hypothetical protein
VNLSYVGSIRVEEPSGDSSLSVAEGEVDTVDQIQARYIVAVANERRKGINVSEEAQWIFNQLHKMLVNAILPKCLLVQSSRAAASGNVVFVHCTLCSFCIDLLRWLGNCTQTSVEI